MLTGWNDAGEGAPGAIRVLAEHWDATRTSPSSTPSRSPTSPPFARSSSSTKATGRSSGQRSTCGRRRFLDRRVARHRTGTRAAVATVLRRGRQPGRALRRVDGDRPRRASPSTRIAGPHTSPRHPPTRRCVPASACAPPATRPDRDRRRALRRHLGRRDTPPRPCGQRYRPYTAQLAAAKATAALVRAVCTMIRAAVRDRPRLPAIADYESRVADLLEDDKLAAYVSRLEEAMPTHVDDDDAGDDLSGELDADGDSRLVAEVEDFENPATPTLFSATVRQPCPRGRRTEGTQFAVVSRARSGSGHRRRVVSARRGSSERRRGPHHWAPTAAGRASSVNQPTSAVSSGWRTSSPPRWPCSGTAACTSRSG